MADANSTIKECVLNRIQQQFDEPARREAVTAVDIIFGSNQRSILSSASISAEILAAVMKLIQQESGVVHLPEVKERTSALQSSLH